jgi:hypothetical protein
MSKHLPHVGGVAVTLVAFAAIQWLDGPWWVSLIVFALAIVGLTLVLLIFLVLKSLPKELSLIPKPGAFTADERQRIEAEVAACGFRPVGPPLEATVSPAGWLLLFCNDAGSFATFSRTGTAPSVDTFDLVSTFDVPGKPGLATVGNVMALSFPTAELDLRQGFDGAPFDQLARRHEEALQVARERGIPIRPADPAEFESLSQQSLSEMRERFVRGLPFSILGVVWRSTTKRSPHLGPINEQPVAQRVLDELQELAAGSRAHPGPPRTF